MNRRMKKLLKDMNIPENKMFTIDSEKMICSVKERINENEQRRVAVWGRRALVLPVALIIILMMAITTVAVYTGGFESGFIAKLFPFVEESTEVEEELVKEDFVEPETEAPTQMPTEEPTEIVTRNPKYESPIFDKYMQEDAQNANELVKEVAMSVEDENYILTVNDVLGDSENLYLTVTVEAKTPEARAVLMEGSTGMGITVQGYTGERWSNIGGGTNELGNEARENSRTYSIHSWGTNATSIRVTTKAFKNITDDMYVYFEIEKSRDVVEFDLLGQSFTGGHVRLTKLGINIRVAREETEKMSRARNLNTFFRFKDGALKSFNQLFSFDTSMSFVEGSNYQLYEYSASTKSVLDLSKLSSIIVKGVEYKIDEPQNYTYTEIPPHFKPFTVMDMGLRLDNGSYYVAKLKDILKPMGEVIEIKDEGKFDFSLRGRLYTACAGDYKVYINGEQVYSVYTPPYIDESGEIYIGYDFIQRVLSLQYGEIEGTGVTLIVP